MLPLPLLYCFCYLLGSVAAAKNLKVATPDVSALYLFSGQSAKKPSYSFGGKRYKSQSL
jgi:hypothetical protein